MQSEYHTKLYERDPWSGWSGRKGSGERRPEPALAGGHGNGVAGSLSCLD